MLPAVLITSTWSVVALATMFVLRRWWHRRRVLEALLVDERDAQPDLSNSIESMSPLRRWLYVAGFHHRSSLLIYLAATILLASVGGLIALFAWLQGSIGLASRLLISVPGGVGEVFLPLVYASPIIAVVLPASLPTLVVRSARRRRVRAVEQDLPVTLDLLATLAEAGLAFDTALDRILRSQPADRPLARELKMFQLEILAGRSRVESLRRLSRRLDVPWFSVFVSAIVQAERTGAGLSTVLRIQADDLRNRRRERALGYAMSLPARMTLPLVVCFFPGIAVIVLGPVFFQIIQFLEGMFRQGGR